MAVVRFFPPIHETVGRGRRRRRQNVSFATLAGFIEKGGYFQKIRANFAIVVIWEDNKELEDERLTGR
jgi:hypothetical protein